MRNLGLTFKRDGRFIKLAGYIDEFADYGPLLMLEPPLRLVMRDIVALNSHGIRKWMAFIKTYGIKALELHECPPVFIDAANMIPDVVSPIGNMKRVKSVILPYSCKSCRRSEQLLVKTEDLVVLADGSHDVPLADCSRCGHPLDTEVEPEDHFLFLTCAAEPGAA